MSNKNLQPPAPTKQFLISPPCSPPAGWAQAEECEPIVNQELLAALANLTPGEVHELQVGIKLFEKKLFNVLISFILAGYGISTINCRTHSPDC